MPTYRIHFIGRQKGAIGITYPITEYVKAETPDAAILKLYDTYDHISAHPPVEVPDQSAE